MATSAAPAADEKHDVNNSTTSKDRRVSTRTSWQLSARPGTAGAHSRRPVPCMCDGLLNARTVSCCAVGQRASYARTVAVCLFAPLGLSHPFRRLHHISLEVRCHGVSCTHTSVAQYEQNTGRAESTTPDPASPRAHSCAGLDDVGEQEATMAAEQVDNNMSASNALSGCESGAHAQVRTAYT